MKIVHICLGAFFPDNYSYQENMLPKFHKQMGYEVEVIASLETFDENGKTSFYPEARIYENEYGIKVTRLNYRNPHFIYKKFRRFVGLNDALKKACPDILFIHNCQFLDIDQICDYLKTATSVKVYVDNHADFSNSATNFFSKNILHGIIWKHCSHNIEPYALKFYGVLPARVDFLKRVYKLPEEKCELLVMGADDDAIKQTSSNQVRSEIRSQHNIEDDDFLIMTGGKIDKWKTQTLLLMEAVKGIESNKVKLIVFGSVTQELKDKVIALADGKKVQYIGWIQSKDSYKYFAASDLVVFPGRHSVFWEQVAAQGIPMFCKEWEGTKHVDVGGNVKFLTKDSVDELKENILAVMDKGEEYLFMKRIAEEKGKLFFSYANIAKRSIQE